MIIPVLNAHVSLCALKTENIWKITIPDCKIDPAEE